jgi:scyllo-inositol 2-dehydrogenase (NADP+)
MRVIVIGLGTQGKKRKHWAGPDFVCSVDPHVDGADFTSVQDVPLEDYDAALCCTPDETKYDLLRYLLQNKKHVLVEKPLWMEPIERLKELEALAKKNNVVCYTAYNHRFEPHFQRMKQVIESGELGKIYTCRMFYGNGTARIVRESAWRDKGLGVISDLGSHLIDTCRYWFPTAQFDFRLDHCNRFENRAPDHGIITSTHDALHVELEMTMLMWKNHFTCDILAENGSAHIESLCKWGPATFRLRKRIFPSGKPLEESMTLEHPDPTWLAEYKHFHALCQERVKTDLSQDWYIQSILSGFENSETRKKAGTSHA